MEREINEDLVNCINNCPKTFYEYKEFFTNLFEEKFTTYSNTLGDDVWILGFNSNPHATFRFFDTVGLVCTLYYDDETQEFGVCINAESVIVDKKWVKNKDRHEALILAVMYLFEEHEKTL